MTAWDGVDRRSNTTLSKDDIKEAIDFAMERHLHSDSHQFIISLIEKEKRKTELWEKIKAGVGTWAAIGVVGFFIALVWQDMISYFRGIK